MKITFNITKWEIKRIVDNKEWLLLRFDTKQGATRKTNIWYNKIIKAFEECQTRKGIEMKLCPNCGQEVRIVYSDHFRIHMAVCDNEECRMAHFPHECPESLTSTEKTPTTEGK